MAITTLSKVKKHCKLGNSIYSSYCKGLISFTHKEFLKINKQKKKKKIKKTIKIDKCAVTEQEVSTAQNL